MNSTAMGTAFPNTTAFPSNATSPTNSTSIASALAHKALDYFTGSTTGIIVGVIVVIVLIVAVVFVVRLAIKGLAEAKDRALSKLKDLRKSREQALDMADAVPDISVSNVQPLSTSRRKLDSLGEISFSVRYDDDESDLVVTVHKCTNLPLKYTGGTVYKYVEVELFPYHRMTSNKPKTKYLRNSLEPEFEEEVRIKMSRDEIKDQKMYVHMCDFNQISPRDLIGTYKVDFDDVNVKKGGKETVFSGPLRWIESIRGAERGDICVVLRYFRGEGQLLVTIKEIRGLKPAIGRSTTSAYVKIHLVHGSTELAEYKTKVRRKNFEPVFNQKFKFEIPQNIIEEVNLIIRVKDRPLVGRKLVLGEACIGGDAVGTYFHHWKLTLEKQQDIEMWHCLEILNIVPGKTNLQTAMKAIPVFESSESEVEEDEGDGLLSFIPDLPDIGLPSFGGLFGSSDTDNKKKEEKEKRRRFEEESGQRKESVSL